MGTLPAPRDDLIFSADREVRSVVLADVALDASEPRRDGSADHISSRFDALDEDTDMEGAVKVLLLLSAGMVAPPAGEVYCVVFIIGGTSVWLIKFSSVCICDFCREKQLTAVVVRGGRMRREIERRGKIKLRRERKKKRKAEMSWEVGNCNKSVGGNQL